ncbi:MAG: AraC family transcriptional regulator [Desulfuromonas sp.]|nr:AraC family transcriptional regulator [Desulfuromonas sp.]
MATQASSHKIQTLFIQHNYFPDAPSSCCVVAVSTLLKELILYATTLPRLYPLEGASARLMRVILDQIQVMDVKPLSLSIPAQPKLKQIFSQLCAAPGDKRTLEEWGNSVGATKRTLSRLFQADIGMSFSQWRQQIRILEALRRLAQGEAVTSVAIDLGYDSPSAFISMFKKALGKTPGQYFSTR